MDQKNLEKKTVAELKAIAKELKLIGITTKTKPQLIEMIIAKQPTSEKPEPADKSAEIINKKAAVSSEDKQTTTSEAPSNPEPTSSESSRNTESSQLDNVKQMQSKSISTPNSTPTSITASETKPTASVANQIASNQAQSRNTYINAPQVRPQNHTQQGNQQNLQLPESSRRNEPGQYSNKPNQASNSQSNNFTNEATVEVTGILDIMSDGTHGVLRTPRLAPSDKDTYISISQVKKLKLRKGDVITGTARLPKENERYYSLLWIKTVNGSPIDQLKDRVNFDDMKPVYPDKQMKLENGQFPISNRIIDLLAPIGFGQRAMIVAPPKAGKTTLLKDIAKGINENQPNVTLMVVLIGERPEEVTDIERSVKGIVYASNFDESPASQVAVAELSLERAKRMVEAGQDVIILMDSLTRLARAYNVALPASGRTLSGGLDPVSLYPSKRFFGAARNFENGASLTIVATSLVETGSKMDDVIFEEFKGTGNMELKLDRRMANKRVFPAINLLESGTRNEELLLGTEQLQHSWKIRRMLESLGDEGNEALMDRMKGTKSNEEFLNTLHQY